MQTVAQSPLFFDSRGRNWQTWEINEVLDGQPSTTPCIPVSLDAAVHSAKSRKTSRPPLPDIVIDNLRNAVKSAEERSAHSPSSPTTGIETLHQVIASAKARNHNPRSPSLDSLLDVVRSAEARQTSPPRHLVQALRQAAQSAAARNKLGPEPSSSIKPIELTELPATPAEAHKYSRPSPFEESRDIDPSKERRWVFYQTKPNGGSAPSGTSTPDVQPELQHGALAAFFAQYQSVDFTYEPDLLPLLELGRLIARLGLKRDDPDYGVLHERFGRAMVAEFGIKFGRNMNDLGAWQKLCKRIGIEPVPTTLNEARAKFRATNVNIVQLMMSNIPDGGMPMFRTEEQLAVYTRRRPGLTFPRHFVEERGILWYLLRQIWKNRPRSRRSRI